jgi:two-component system, NarL family, nitrate/nitrite response regulator NarL
VADLPEALSRIAEAAPPYDLGVLDYGMPGMNGYCGLDQALAASAGRPVALMSGLASSGVVERVLAAGAAGYLPKTLPARSLVNAIWTCNGFVPVTYLTMPPWLRTRVG